MNPGINQRGTAVEPAGKQRRSDSEGGYSGRCQQETARYDIKNCDMRRLYKQKRRREQA